MAATASIDAIEWLRPDSFAFRYPKDKQGGSTQLNVPVRINLRFLHEAMQNIANWLDAGHTEASERLQYEREQQAEYEADMRALYRDDDSGC